MNVRSTRSFWCGNKLRTVRSCVYIIVMQQLKMTTLLIILTFLNLTNFSFGQANKDKTIEGKVIISFFMTSAKPIDSYIAIEGTNNKVKIDTTGHFKLTDVKSGNIKLRIELWGGALTKDTTLTVQEDIKDFSYFLHFNCDVNKYKAIYDIHYDKPRLLISGGIAPIVYVGQEKFEEKYGVVYHIYGCFSPDYNCMLEYNQTVFDYLDQTEGKIWRKEVRKDVVGLKKKRIKRTK